MAQAPTATATGTVNSDAISVTVTGAEAGAGSHTATASGLTGDKAGNYKLPSSATHGYSIGKAALTVTANPKTITYGDAPANDGVSYSGFVNGETEAELGGTLSYTYSYSQYGNVGNSYTITPSGLTSDNYDITFTAGTLTVVQKDVTVAAEHKTKTYGEANPELTAQVSGTVNGESGLITYELNCTAVTNSDVGDYTITASGTADQGNYNVAFVNNTLTVGKATYTGTKTASAAPWSNKVTTDATLTLPALPDGASYPASGTVGGTTALISGHSIDGTTLTYSTTAQAADTSATITIPVTNATNYSPYDVVVTLTTQNKADADASITGGDKTVTYGDENFILTGAVTDAGHGTGVWTWSSSTASVATIDAGTGEVTIVGQGTTTITATYESDDTLGSAAITLTVNKKNVTITGLGAADKVYNNSTAATVTGTAVISGKVGNDDVTVEAGTAAFADKNVGTDKDVTFSNYSLTGAKAGNYTLSAQPASVKANITAKEITVSGITASDKVYDGNTEATLVYTGATFGGILDGTLTVTATGTFDSKNIGTGRTVTISNLTLGGDTDNYVLAASGQQATATANITAKEITVDGITAENKVYDKTTAAELNYSSVTLTGRVGTEDVSVTATGTFANADVGNGKTVTISELALTGNDKGNYVLAASGQQATATANISKKAVTVSGITASDKSYDGDTTATLVTTSAAFAGIEDGDTLTVTATGTFDNKNVGTDKEVTISGLVLGGTSVDNYELAAEGQQTGTTANISKKAVTVSGITAVNKNYDGGTEATLNYSGATFAGKLDGDELSVTATGTFSDKTVGNNKTVSISDFVLDGASAGNYAVADTGNQTTAEADIAARGVTITGLGAADKVYDGNTDATVTGTAAIDGKVESDDLTVVDGTAAFADKDANTDITVSFTGYSLTGADAGNYNLTAQPANVTAEITAKPVTITGLTAEDKTYDGTTDATATGTPVIDGKVGSDDVSATIGTAAFADAKVGTGKTVSFSGYALDGADKDNYTLSAQPADVTAAITAKEITVSGIKAENKEYDGGSAATLDYTSVTLDGYVDGDLSVTATGAFADAKVGDGKTVTISDLTLTGEDKGNYVLATSGQQTETTADITVKAVTVSGITAEDKIYDTGTEATLVFTGAAFDGKLDSDKLSVTATGAFADANVGENKTVNISGLILGGDDAGNYVLATSGQQATATASITAKEVANPTVTAENCTYTGKELTPTVTVKDGEAVIPESEYTVAYSDNTLAGTAAVTITDKEGGNYTVSGSTTFEIAHTTGDKHNLTAHEAIAVGCETDGSSAYWSCSECGKFFSDAEGTKEIEENSWIIPATGHKLTAHPATEPTGAADGNTAYWSCDNCGKFFSDADGKTEIGENSWLIPATGFLVTFDSDGGTAVAAQNVADGKTAAKPDDPTKEGWIFEGWLLADEAFDFSTPIHENITLKAKWTFPVAGVAIDENDDIHLRYFYNSKTEETEEVLSLILNTAKDDVTYQLSATVTPEDATNKAVVWSSDSDVITVTEDGLLSVSKGTRGSATVTVTTADSGKTAELFVAADIMYNLTFKDGKTEVVAEATGWVFDDPIADEDMADWYGFTAPEGKKFKAWSDGEKEYLPGEQYTATDDVVFEAVWEDITWTVTYETNGGSKIEPKTVAQGTTIGQAKPAAAPTRSGYTFAGWYTDEALTEAADDSTAITADITLYAKWTVVQTSYDDYDEPTTPTETEPAETEPETVTETTTVENEDGSVTETTTETTTVENEDGSVTETVVETKTTTDAEGNETTTVTETETTTAETENEDGSKTVTETKTETVTDAEGNVTTTVTETETATDAEGNVTETVTETETTETENADGSKTTTETQTETVTDADGNVTETVTETETTETENADGSKTTTATQTVTVTDAEGNETTTVTEEKTVELADGSTGTVVSDAEGNTLSAEANLSEEATSALSSDEIITLPILVTAADESEDAAEIGITFNEEIESVKIEIPVENLTPGTVAVIVHEDGTEEIVKTSYNSEDGVVLTLEGNATVKIVDNTKEFDDAPEGKWYSDYVAWVSSREIMNGTDKGFEPDLNTSRAMVTQLLFNLEGAEAGEITDSFDDVSEKDWYAASVSWAEANGITKGMGDSFGANNEITREQLVVMLYNYAVFKGYDVSAADDMAAFTDADSVSDWAETAMRWAVGVGLINGMGDGTVNPQGFATRAQIAAVTQRFCEKVA